MRPGRYQVEGTTIRARTFRQAVAWAHGDAHHYKKARGIVDTCAHRGTACKWEAHADGRVIELAKRSTLTQKGGGGC